MSKAPEEISLLEAEILLARAVSEFEADLSDDQKADFNTERSRSIKEPPTLRDVIDFTEKIDQKWSAKMTRGRCLGTRTTRFLQCVQQFAALGDIIIGGSQQIIACGVWTLVRMSLLLALNAHATAYFEKLSYLFMTIGCSTPRFEKFSRLYPRSIHLKASLFEYFVVVVRLCHQILLFTKKSALRRLGASLTSDLAEHQSKLEFYATSIRDEVAFLIAQRIEGQVESESHSRSDTLMKSESRAEIPVAASIKRSMRFSSRLLPVNYITENVEPDYDEPDYDEPDYDEPDYDEPDYDEPDYDEPDNGEPDYDEPDYDEPDYDESDNGEPDNGEPDYDEAGRALKLVINYFQHEPSGMAAHEYVTIGKLMERIELAKLAGRERKV